MRVRSSAVAGVESGYVRVINGNDGTIPDHLTFVPELPNDLANGDVIEIHSGRYERPLLKWEDADLADIWWEILTIHLQQPAERIGRGDMGHGARAGLPPRVEDIEPDDDDAQAKRLVTIQLSGDRRRVGRGSDQSDLLSARRRDGRHRRADRLPADLSVAQRGRRDHGRAGSGRGDVRRAQHDQPRHADRPRAAHLAAGVQLRRGHDGRREVERGRADDGVRRRRCDGLARRAAGR
jgi:hypothetical protein